MKHGNRSNEHLTVNIDEAVGVNHKKAKYSSPKLKPFGSVSHLTRNGAGTGTDGGSVGMSMKSDPESKENIVKIGTHQLGFGIYLFDYKPEFRNKWGSGRQFGVMANEVEAVMPEAVAIDTDGYKVVDYGMLGVHPAIH
jgi:Chaperone of endosialidase